LNCTNHKNGASAEKMVNQLLCDMDAWGLEKDYFMAAVTESDSNMNAFGRTM